MAKSSVLIFTILLVVVSVVTVGYWLTLPAPPSNEVQIAIQIIGDDRDYFNPSNVTVKSGQSVTLVVHNGERVVHGFAIDQFGINATIPAGATVRMTFSANRIGVFRF